MSVPKQQLSGPAAELAVEVAGAAVAAEGRGRGASALERHPLKCLPAGVPGS